MFFLSPDFPPERRHYGQQTKPVITALIHPDQTGFMPGRGTDINISRLHTHIAKADPVNPVVLASLDTGEGV